MAVVRGFEKHSREIRGTVRDIAGALQHRVLDLPTDPRFGAIPAVDVRAVVATRPSLVPTAARCAAHWGCRLIEPVAHPADSATFRLRPAPALSIQTADGLRDRISDRFQLDGLIHYQVADLPEVLARVLAVEPQGNRMRLCHRDTDGRRDRSEPAGAVLRLRLDEPTPGVIDGHQQIFPVGDYIISADAVPGNSAHDRLAHHVATTR
ncbi:hypothetical protein AB0M48_11205 [Lentzea sp. NPDC051208]|uniref:hypothetical protein n=1 Tax=Lentzea sp. NPDC051208 TaxID=3154642 RepID=UPI00342C3C8B